MPEEKHAGGRPPIYDKVEDMHEKIQLYFEQFKYEGAIAQLGERRPTITGLVLFLGFESRQSFYEYEKKEQFCYTIRRSRAKIENIYENMLGTQSTTGAIFALKNFDWSDKSEIDHTTKGEKMAFTLNVMPDKDEPISGTE